MAAVLKPSEIYLIRSELKDNYSKVDNKLYDEPLLNDQLRDLLNDIMRRPITWRVKPQQLAKTRNVCKRTIQRKLNKLCQLGYVKRHQLRASKSGFGEMLYYVSDKPIFKKSESFFGPKLVDILQKPVPENPPESVGPTIKQPNSHSVPDSVENHTESVAISVDIPQIVGDTFVHAPACHPYKEIFINNKAASKASLYQPASKQQASHATQVQQATSKLSEIREMLENQIRVSKQTCSGRLAAYAAAGIFKKKSGRERLDKMNATMRAEALARRNP